MDGSRNGETARTWGRAVAPVAEWVARTLSSGNYRTNRQSSIATRLTQSNRRAGRDGIPVVPTKAAPREKRVCEICGTSIPHNNRYCVLCVTAVSKEQLAEVAKRGRMAAQSSEAQARRSDTKRRHDVARRGWVASSQPAWLNNETYVEKIQPQLAGVTYSAIASALAVSLPYAADIRAGRRRPHPRHWNSLARLVGLSANPIDC